MEEEKLETLPAGVPHYEREDANTTKRHHGIISWVYWVPPWCRWNTINPPPFTLWLNILFAAAGGFTSANLFYSHPILNVLARDFRTTQAGVSTIPTLAQAGDATGLLLVLPLADFFPRRKFTLTLITLSALFWYDTKAYIFSYASNSMAGSVSASLLILPPSWFLRISLLSSLGRRRSCFHLSQSCQLPKPAHSTSLLLVLGLLSGSSSLASCLASSPTIPTGEMCIG